MGRKVVGWGRVIVGFAVVLTAFAVEARRGAPPPSQTVEVAPLERVALLELGAIDRQALLAEDEEKAGPGPRRFASPVDLELTPASHGTWEELADGSRLWRLRVAAPGATDLNFGFTRFDLPDGATLHVASLDLDYFQGPYTSRDHKDHGELWTPVVPGSRAILELWVPARAKSAPELELARVSRGYRDLFALDVDSAKQGDCNNDVICPEGDPWRDEIRSVGAYSIGGYLSCTGTMVMNVREDFRPLFLTANHCSITSTNDQTIVVYWNYESPNCGDLSGGSFDDNQSGATLLANRTDNDFAIIELDQDPDPDFNVYFAGWDARPTTAPQSSVCIHHPDVAEKAISFNDDPLTTGNSCIGSGGVNSHWWVDNWEDGTTEPGSSGSGLWDPATHLLVGYLSGGQASCTVIDYDCFGKLAVGWDGSSPASRLRDWLDPDDSDTLTVAGSNAAPHVGYAGHQASDSCSAGAGDDNGIWEPGETIQIAVDLRAGGSFSGVQGTLSSSTPGVTVVDSTATWANMSQGSTVTSDPPHFTIRLASDIECYGTVDLALTVTTNEGGPFSYTISESIGQALLPDTPLSIPDPGTVTSSLEIDDDATLSDVNVRVRIDHTYVGDLTVALASPEGTQVVLLERPGHPAEQFGCSDNNMDVTFDDSAGVELEDHCEGTTPWYSGEARPVDSLSAFSGESAQGTWTLTVTDGMNEDSGDLISWELITSPSLGGQCQVCEGGTVPSHSYLVAGIARQGGVQGTDWHSKLALLNLSGQAAEVTASYVRTGGTAETSLTLAHGELRAWDDVAVSLFGVTGTSSGAVKVDSTQPLVVTARTFNQTDDGTYGQYLPGVVSSQALQPGQTGVVSPLTGNDLFRTNVGFVNLGASACSVAVVVHDTTGLQSGATTNASVPAYGWKQINDIFASAGAGSHDNAYATISVMTPGCSVWAYASVVDEDSGDPTTFPLAIMP